MSQKKQVEKAFELGQIAKLKLYKEFLERISKGEQLKPSELKKFRELEEELEESIYSEEKKGDVCKSNAEAARYCKVSTRVISYHLTRGNIKQEPDGVFKTEELDKWLESRGRKIRSHKKFTKRF